MLILFSIIPWSVLPSDELRDHYCHSSNGKSLSIKQMVCCALDMNSNILTLSLVFWHLAEQWYVLVFLRNLRDSQSDIWIKGDFCEFWLCYVPWKLWHIYKWKSSIFFDLIFFLSRKKAWEFLFLSFQRDRLTKFFLSIVLIIFVIIN